MNEDEINHFYEVSELDRQDVLKWCSESGITEDEFIKTQLKTLKYEIQDFNYALFKIVMLKDFWILFFIFWIGLGLILYFVK